MKKIILMFICSALSIGFIQADEKDSYIKAWDLLLNNNRTEARIAFAEALNNPTSKPDALASMSILDWSEQRKESAFANLSNLVKATDDYSSYVYALATEPYGFSGRGYQEKDKLALLHSLENTPQTTLRAVVNGYLGAHYQVVKEKAKAASYFAKIGALDKWSVLGSFDNESGGGFSKDWGAVDKAEPSAVFLNKQNVEVQWFYPGANKPDQWFDLTYSFYPNNAIIYAQCFVMSPLDVEAYLRIGVSGSLKAWVNDALVLSEIEERNCDLDLYATKIKLKKGANRVLLQLGSSEISTSNFLARITSDEGNIMDVLTHTHEYRPYTKADSAPTVQSLPFAPEADLQAKIKQDTSNMLNYVLLAQIYLKNDKKDESIELLKKVQQKYPKSTLLHMLLVEAYSRAENQTYSTKELEAIKAEDPQSYIALQSLMVEAQRSSKIPDVKKLLEQITSLYGDSDYTHSIAVWLASRQNNQQETIALARTYYKKYPYSYDCMMDVYNIESNTLKNSKAADNILENYNKKYFDPSAMQVLATRYLRVGNTKKALLMFEDRINEMPYASGYLSQYANTMLDMQRYSDALKLTETLLTKNPYLGYYYGMRADIHKAMENKDLAISDYRKALHYSPGDFESFNQLRLLGAEKEMEDYFPKHNLDSLIAKAGSQSDYPEDNSILVLYADQVLMQESGASETRTELAVKILNKSGVEAWKEYGIGWYSGQSVTLDKAEVIKANGQKVKAETNGPSQIVFTDLEIGDVLHLDYRLRSYLPGKLAKTFDNLTIFQFMMPAMHIEYSFMVPRGLNFDYKLANSDLNPTITEVEGLIQYKWEMTNMSAVKEEPLMSPLLDVVPTLSLSNIPNWGYVRDWYNDVTTNKFKPDYLLRETMGEILKGKDDASQLEKAELFYTYILKTITYSNVPFMQDNQIPQVASRTIATRLGDCKDMSTLFVALCREAGIEANLVLILTRDNPDSYLALPSTRFNHCIAQLLVDDKTYYLELTDNKLPFGAAVTTDIQAYILPMGKHEGEENNKIFRMEMPFRMKNEVIRKADLSLNGSSFAVKIDVTHRGNNASQMRYNFADIGLEEQVKNLNQAVAADYRNATKMKNLKFTNLDNLADTVIYSYNLEVQNMVQEVANMEMFRLVWADNHGSLEEISLATRKYPFLNWYFSINERSVEEIRLNLPAGKRLIEKPKDVVLECQHAKYSLIFDTKEKGVVKVVRTYVPKADIVTPADYQDFSDFVREVSKNDNKQYAIK